MAPAAEWRFRVLGPLEVACDGSPVPLGGTKRRALLGRLLVAGGQPLSAERLVADVWGDDRRIALSTVQSHIALLRQALGADRIRTDGAGYRLVVAAAELDSTVFEDCYRRGRGLADTGRAADSIVALGEALGLWRGPAFDDVADADWCRGEATRLDELRVGAEEAWLQARLRSGDAVGVVADAAAAVDRWPLRERLWGLLIAALAGAGRQADALRAFQRLRSTLADELGLEPSVELTALEHAVLTQAPLPAWSTVELVAAREHDPTLRSVESAVDRPPTGTVELRFKSAGVDVFVGRDRELSRLHAAVAASVSGCRIVVVAGDAGVGKSTLVERCCGAALAPVVVGRCVDRDLVFVPVIAVIRHLSRILGDRFEDTVGAARDDIARIVPDVFTDAPVRDQGTGPQQVFDAVAQVLGRAAADDGLVVVIEDVHWADQATLDFVRYCALTLEQARVTFVLTTRSVAADQTTGLRAWLSELGRLRHVDIVSLEPFTRAETGQLIERVAPSLADAADLLHRRSGGNAFFLHGLVDAGAGPLQDLASPVRDTLTARLESLEPADRDVASRAAVIGGSVPHRLLTRICNETAPMLRRRLRRLIDAGVLAADAAADEYRFCHALWQEAVSDRLLPGEQAELHADVAAALEDDHDLVGGGDPVVWPLIARHWERAGRRREAVIATMHAARAVAAVGLAADAAVLFRTVLDRVNDASGEIDATAVALDAAGADADAADYHSALGVLDERVPPGEVRGMRLRARCLAALGREPQAVVVAEQAVGAASDDVSRGWALSELAALQDTTGRHDAAGRTASQAVAAARRTGDKHLLAGALTQLGATRHNPMALYEAVAVARQLGDGRAVVEALDRLLYVLRTAPNLEVNRSLLAETLHELTAVLHVPMPVGFRARIAGYVASGLDELSRFADADVVIAGIADIPYAGADGYSVIRARAMHATFRDRLSEAASWFDRGWQEPALRPMVAGLQAWLFSGGDPAVVRTRQAVVDAGSGPVSAATRLVGLLRVEAIVALDAQHRGDADRVLEAQRRARAAAARCPRPQSALLALAVDAELAVLNGVADPELFARAADICEAAAIDTDAAIFRVRELDVAVAVGDVGRAHAVAATISTAAAAGNRLVARLVAERVARAGLTINGDSAINLRVSGQG